MCIAVMAWGLSPRYPLIVAANRDEFFDRPALPMAWWTPAGGTDPVLSGRDLRAGGTWMGLNAAGRLAIVTNVRTPVPPEFGAPSRGTIVTNWLRHQTASERFWPHAVLSGYSPFNVVALDLRSSDAFWGSNWPYRSHRLRVGLHGVSNAALDTPWPKLQALKARLARLVRLPMDRAALFDALFAALRDDGRFPDETLPDTGIGLAKERMLSSVFVRSEDGRYGTRSSTVLVTERQGETCGTWVEERSFGSDGFASGGCQFSLPDWPPRQG